MGLGPALDSATVARLRDMAGDEATLDSLASTFLSEAKRLVAVIRNAVERGGADDLYVAAHTLKGASVNLGAIRLIDLSRGVEQMSRDQFVAVTREMIEELETELGRVESAMRSEGLFAGGGGAEEMRGRQPE